MTSLDMEMNGIAIGAEVSPPGFRGLSNLEMGDMFPNLYAMTSETVNPAQGKIRGITDECLPIKGQDVFYDKASELGYLFTPWEPGTGSPLELRVSRNIQELQSLCAALEEVTGIQISWERIPTPDDILANGVGYYLNPQPEVVEDPGFRSMPGIWKLLFM